MKSTRIVSTAVVLLLAVSFFAGSASAASNPSTTRIISSGSKVIGVINITSPAVQARDGSKQLVVTESWQVTEQGNGSDPTYYSKNVLSFSCSTGTDWNEQDGEVIVTNGVITGYYSGGAHTKQSYTYLGCAVNFDQTGNTASNLGPYVDYYTTGNLQTCFFICENFGYYYQDTNLYSNGNVVISDSCSGTPTPPCSGTGGS